MEQADGPPRAGEDIIDAALRVLRQPDPHKKAEYTNIACQLWRSGQLTCAQPGAQRRAVPDRPARDDEKVKLLSPKDMPRRGKGGSLASRQALLHSLVHIENWAVDLAWDIIARFGQDPSYRLPPAFFNDFITVAEDECRHFLLLEARLEETGSRYGALPAHDGLWESAWATAGNLAARLAVEHCTHEARGLDVLPQTIHRFRSNGDEASAALLEDVIYAEEISHCAAGVRWLKHLHAVALMMGCEGAAGAAQPEEQAAAEQAQQALGALRLSEAQQAGPCCTGSSSSSSAVPCAACSAGACPGGHGASHERCGSAPGAPGAAAGAGQDGIPQWAAEARQHATVEAWFHALIRRHFRGPLKPPFNEDARAKAGFGSEWYLPLAEEEDGSGLPTA